ncbi:unnamed protein product [Durusdinium trenchii]|uniref:Trichohyalin-plectin-homology domain-containing protein n=1 Tax=Durusdinium trenchii TaxID=1381693 RepID=A0ABP0NYT0_9DINO
MEPLCRQEPAKLSERRAETRASALRVEIAAWQLQEKRLSAEQTSEAAACRRLRERLASEELGRSRAQEAAIDERRSEAWAAQRSLQVHHGLARAKRAAAELRQLWRNSVDEGMHTEPEKQEDLRQLELEEREAEVSAWWSRKRLQDLQREVEDLEEHRHEMMAEKQLLRLKEEEYTQQLRACQVEAERVAVQEENARVELVDNTRHYMSRARRNRKLVEQLRRDEEALMLRQKSYAFALAAKTINERS